MASILAAASMSTPTTTTSSLFFETISACGITHAFANWGSDHPGLLEDLQRQLASKGTMNPKIITCPNEMVALSSAQGYAQVTGRPALCIVHVDVGTLAMAGAIHNVDRSRTPVVIYAGASPFSLDREHKAGRNEWIMGIQDIPDQTAIVRQYMRAVLQINSGPTIGTTIKRAVQIATSAPKGPVYVWARREIMEEDVDPLMLKDMSNDLSKWPAIDPPGISQSSLMDIVQSLIAAEKPLIITSHLGRSPTAVQHLTKLSNLLSIPIVETSPSSLNVPFSHPYNLGVTFLAPGTHVPLLKEADVILILDSYVPWIPGAGDGTERPRDGAKIIIVDPADPINRNFQNWHLPADIICLADMVVALDSLCATIKRVLGQTGALEGPLGEKIVSRGIEMEKLHDGMVVRLDQAEFSSVGSNSSLPTAAQVVGTIRRSIEPYKALALAEGISNFQTVWAHLRVESPGLILSAGGSSLGWGIGAAVGAALGMKECERTKDVDLLVSIVGDGSFLFGIPSSAFWMAQKYATPFLTIILNNSGWKSPRYSTLEVYPQGLASSQPGHLLTVGFGGPDSSPPDYVGIAVAASSGWAWGKKVTTFGELDAVLKEAVRVVVEDKRCAIVDCIIESI